MYTPIYTCILVYLNFRKGQVDLSKQEQFDPKWAVLIRVCTVLIIYQCFLDTSKGNQTDLVKLCELWCGVQKFWYSKTCLSSHLFQVANLY